MLIFCGKIPNQIQSGNPAMLSTIFSKLQNRPVKGLIAVFHIICYYYFCYYKNDIYSSFLDKTDFFSGAVKNERKKL